MTSTPSLARLGNTERARDRRPATDLPAAVPEPERRKQPDLSVPARRKWAAGIFTFVAIPLGISWGAFGFSQRKAQTPGW